MSPFSSGKSSFGFLWCFDGKEVFGVLFQIILKLLADECYIFCLVKSTVNHLMKANYFPATPSDAISDFEQVTSGGGSPCWQLCLPQTLAGVASPRQTCLAAELMGLWQVYRANGHRAQWAGEANLLTILLAVQDANANVQSISSVSKASHSRVITVISDRRHTFEGFKILAAFKNFILS